MEVQASLARLSVSVKNNKLFEDFERFCGLIQIIAPLASETNWGDSGGNSNYNAFWATINKHLSHGDC